jgi:hypothetical protein
VISSSPAEVIEKYKLVYKSVHGCQEMLSSSKPLCITTVTFEVAFFFVTGLETLQILGVQM